VEKTGDDGYRISLAVAGFAADELELVAQPNLLIVAGRSAAGADDSGARYLHRGIAARNFERKFELADYVVVKSASYENGVLAIDLAREIPEALQPRRIEIGAAETSSAVRRMKKQSKDHSEPGALNGPST